MLRVLCCFHFAGMSDGIAEAANERFKQLKMEMKQRDKEDRQLEKQRLREKRYKQKAKLQAVSDDEEEEDDEDGVRLHASNDVSGSESGEENIKERQRRQFRRAGAKEVSESSSGEAVNENYDTDSDAPPKKQRGRSRAHKSSKGDVVQKNAPERGDGLSLAEQEALALKLLKMRR